MPPFRVNSLSRWAAVLLAVGLPLGLLVYFSASKSRRVDNERQAEFGIQSLAKAESEFRKNDSDKNEIHDFWTGDVAGLYRYGLIDRELAEADATPLVPLVPKPIPKNGHLYRALRRDQGQNPPDPYAQQTDRTSGNVHHREKFAFCVYPVEPGATGRYIWIVNENNTAFRSNDHISTPLPPIDWPGEPKLREWSQVQ